MIKRKLIKDGGVKITKKLLKEETFIINAKYYNPIKFKIKNLRKYQSWAKGFSYEFDVIVELISEDRNPIGAWHYVYYNNNKRSYNKKYRRFIETVLEEELKYYGYRRKYDDFSVKKINYEKFCN